MVAVIEVVRLIGSQSKVALELGTTQPVVWRWVQRKRAPAKYIRRISNLTGNKVTIEQLLSDHEKKENL